MKISVIIPVYNVEQYLHQCIDSVINQSYHNLEIILINDGSQDSSGAICDDFAKRDPRVHVIHQQNAGVSVARNTGISRASGEYLTFVDSDDWIDTDMYLTMAKTVIDSPGLSVVMCDFRNEREQISEQISASIRAGIYNKERIVKDLYPTLLVTEGFGRLPIVSTCICLFKSDLFTHHAIVFDAELKYSEDYLFMAQIMIAADSFYYLKGHYFYHYRQHQESRSKKYKREWWDNLLRLNEELERALSGQNDYDFSRQLKLQLLHSVLLVSTSIVKNDTMQVPKKLKELNTVFSSKEVSSVFSRLQFTKVSSSQRFVLFLIKSKKALSYLIYIKIVNSIKKLSKSFQYYFQSSISNL